MKTLRTLWTKDPGLFLSASVHVLAFVFLLVNFARPPHFDEALETVPVEMVTTSDFNQIMNGEKTAKQLPTPQRRVDKVAELEERKPAPPLAEAKKDTPPPPSPEKAAEDPGQDEKKAEPVAAAPPPPAPPVVTPPPPTPPQRPVQQAEAPKPPPRPEPETPPPPDAEALAPKPPPRPKVEPKKEVKKVAKVKLAKLVPDPPPRPDPPKPEPKPEPLDMVARLLDKLKPPTPPVKPRAGNEAKDQPHSDFSLDKITALLDHEAPQRKASTGHQLTQMASLGSPTAHADKMSPSMMSQLDGWLIDHYRGCWSYFGLGATQDYVPEVRVRMAQDGSLIGQPSLLNPPTDPNLRSLADSAIRAVNRCHPMVIPDRFRPFYDAWRQRVVRFDPKELS